MRLILFSVLVSLFMPVNSWALVPHNYPGYYIHQMGHLYFLLSCAFVIWIILRDNLQGIRGWRYLLFAEIFFILWNLDAFIGHISEFWISADQIIGKREGWDYFKREIILEGKEYVYYITKLDHLWLVPAMLFFYLGLRAHLESENTPSRSLAMVLPLFPIIFVDIIGSMFMIVLAVLSLHAAIRLYKKDRDNALWNYMLWLSSSIVVFSFSRSVGHIVQRMLIPTGYESVWRIIEPYSGSLNTFTFIVIGSISFFFYRAYESYLRISEDKKKIEAINADLIELNHEMETLVAERTMSLMALTVADRIRNPAISIGCTSKKLLEREITAERLHERLKIISSEAEKLESIVCDFERLLKSRQSKFRYEDISDVLKGVVSVVEKDAIAKGINLHVEIKGPLKINAQKNLLRVAIFHVLRNAIEATPEGGTVRLTASADKDRVTITVSDTGEGIAKEDLDRIFEPFYTTKPHRFGMGLPIVKQIISEHLGEISVDSLVSKGTTFQIYLPTRWKETKFSTSNNP